MQIPMHRYAVCDYGLELLVLGVLVQPELHSELLHEL